MSEMQHAAGRCHITVCFITTFTICVTEGRVNLTILENLCPSTLIFGRGRGCFCKCVYVLVAADSIGNQLASVPDFCILIKFSHASMLDLCCDGS